MNTIGVYGLGVMGRSLARNLLDKGFSVSVYNIETEVTETIIRNYPGLNGYTKLVDFVKSLQQPRKIIIMVSAGAAVDSVLASLIPLLDKEDIVIDCGNSFYKDSERRMQALKQAGIRMIGCGVSGGEKGALHGPSMMPSGDKDTYREIADIFEKMAAANNDKTACCTYIGENGAGHFVKMVHNGIEYADMQLIAECYSILKSFYPSDKQAIQTAFHQLNQDCLQSYLLDITEDILQKQENDEWLLDKVSDVAKQKGTGKWTAMASLEYDVPVPSLLEAVEARFLSAMKEERCRAQKSYPCENHHALAEISAACLYEAMFLAKTSIYAQGFSLITKVDQKQSYHIDPQKLAVIWQNGCIIKSGFLKEIVQAYEQSPKLTNLLLSSIFMDRIKVYRPALQKVVQYAAARNLYLPVFASAMNYLNGFTSAHLETNLIQAQRDCFGAHTYQRIDRDGTFHSDWQN